MEEQDKKAEPLEREAPNAELLSREGIEAIITKKLRGQRTEVTVMIGVACVALVEAISFDVTSTWSGKALAAAIVCGLGLTLPAVRTCQRFYKGAAAVLRTQKPVRTFIVDIRHFHSSYDVYLADRVLGRPAGEHDRRPGSLLVHTNANKDEQWEKNCLDGDSDRAAALLIPADVYIDPKSGNCVAIVVSDDLAWRVCKLEAA